MNCKNCKDVFEPIYNGRGDNQQIFCSKQCRKRFYGRECYARRIKRDPSYNRRQDLKSNYGLTEIEFNSLAEKQQYLCAICRIRPLRLFVDHDHKTNKVRGLLCSQCNVGIGFLKENPEIFKSAIIYLEKTYALCK